MIGLSVSYNIVERQLNSSELGFPNPVIKWKSVQNVHFWLTFASLHGSLHQTAYNKGNFAVSDSLYLMSPALNASIYTRCLCLFLSNSVLYTWFLDVQAKHC